MDNEDVVHMHREYYSAIKRNEIGSCVEMGMDPETAIQSEGSWKEKIEHCILMHIWGILKNWYRQFYLQDRRGEQTKAENNYMDNKWKSGRWDELGDRLTYIHC